MKHAPGLLDGFVIADLGFGMAAALVAKFLTDNGAKVIRAEPATGDPFYDYYPAYEVWRRGEEHMSGAVSSETLKAVLDTADACILGGESFPGLPSQPEAEALAKAHPKLVVFEITGNPKGIAGGERPSTDLLAQARSGLCYEHFSTRPIAMSFEPGNYGAALQGLCALLAALYEKQASGRGQVVRTSLLEGALTWITQLWLGIEKPTPSTPAQPKDLHPLIFRCADGVYVHLVLGSAGSKYKLYKVLGIDDPSVKPSDNGMPNLSDGPRNFFGDIDLLAKHVARFQSQTLLAALVKEGLPVEVVLAPGACWDNPQVQHNGLIDTDADRTRHVGNPVIVARTSEANAKITPKASDRPLGGVRVIDYGAYVAGPQASLILADLGADVIKVEPVGGDPSRAMARSYIAVNRGKRGVALDLKSKTGVEIAQKLAVSADVVTNNFRSGVSERLGIDPKTLHAMRPDLIILESPGYGVDGPMAQRAAFDLVMQAVCGHEMKAAGEGNDPFWNRTYMVDFAGGMVGAVGVLAALNYRARTGNGAALVTPLLNGGVFLLSELVQRPDGSWDGLRPLNANQTGYSPFEAMYQARDGWLAIVARGAKARQALLQTLGLSEAFATYEAIGRAVAGRSTQEFCVALEAAGVWAEPCRKNAERETLADPALHARGNVRVTRHAKYGGLHEIGCLYTFSRSKVGTDLPIHELGEHTREVLDMLNYSAEQIETLKAGGVVVGA